MLNGHGLVIGGAVIPVAGLAVYNWHDHASMPRLRSSDYRPRETSWVRMLVLHTTKGDEPLTVVAGSGPTGMASETARAWAHDPTHSGSHLLVDGDGSVWCVADLAADAAYHAEDLNEVSVGIEICQTPGLEIFEAQLEATVRLCDALTRLLRIQRQFHAPYLGEATPVGRLAAGGTDCVGVFGHRDQTTARGPGDPGDPVFKRLRLANYEQWNFDEGDDLDAWVTRQTALGVDADGIPGPGTTNALEDAGLPNGLWISRPGD